MEIKSINSFWDLSKTSVKLGAKTGLIVSSLYLVYLIVRLVISMVIKEHGTSLLFGIIFIIITGIIFGIIPSMFLGIFTAFVISCILWLLKRRLSATLSFLIGFMVCTGFIVLAFYVSRWQGIDFTSGESGLFGIVSLVWFKPIPLTIYTLTGGYMSWKNATLLSNGSSDINLRSNDDKIEGVLP